MGLGPGIPDPPEHRLLPTTPRVAGTNTAVPFACVSNRYSVAFTMSTIGGWRALASIVAHHSPFSPRAEHQGVGNVLIVPRAFSEHREGPVIRRPRLGGMLNYYERAAA